LLELIHHKDPLEKNVENNPETKNISESYFSKQTLAPDESAKLF